MLHHYPDGESSGLEKALHVYGMSAKPQVRFVSLIKSHSGQSCPSAGLSSEVLPIPFKIAAALPAQMASPCPADVYPAVWELPGFRARQLPAGKAAAHVAWASGTSARAAEHCVSSFRSMGSGSMTPTDSLGKKKNKTCTCKKILSCGPNLLQKKE